MTSNYSKKCADEDLEKYFCHFNFKLFETCLMKDEDSQCDSDPEIPNQDEESSTNTSSQSIKETLDEEEEKCIPGDLLGSFALDELVLSDYEETTEGDKNMSIGEKLSDSQETDATEKEKELKPEFEKFKLPKSLFDSDPKKVDNTPNSTLLMQLNLYSAPFIPKTKIDETPMTVCFYPQKFCNKFELYNSTMPIFNSKGVTNFGVKKCQGMKKKKKKKEFVEREGDWSCYYCKNLNFGFRQVCNKCGSSREKSEQKFLEVGEQLLKLADLSVYTKKKTDDEKNN